MNKDQVQSQYYEKESSLGRNKRLIGVRLAKNLNSNLRVFQLITSHLIILYTSFFFFFWEESVFQTGSPLCIPNWLGI